MSWRPVSLPGDRAEPLQRKESRIPRGGGTLGYENYAGYKTPATPAGSTTPAPVGASANHVTKRSPLGITTSWSYPNIHGDVMWWPTTSASSRATPSSTTPSVSLLRARFRTTRPATSTSAGWVRKVLAPRVTSQSAGALDGALGVQACGIATYSEGDRVERCSRVPRGRTSIEVPVKPSLLLGLANSVFRSLRDEWRTGEEISNAARADTGSVIFERVRLILVRRSVFTFVGTDGRLGRAFIPWRSRELQAELLRTGCPVEARAFRLRGV